MALQYILHILLQSKELTPIEVIPLPMVASVKPESRKTYRPITETLSGILIFLSALQL